MAVAVRVTVSAACPGTALTGALTRRVAVGVAVVVTVGVPLVVPAVPSVALRVRATRAVAGSVTGTMAPVAGSPALPGAVATPRVGGRIGVLLCRGHRQIIARTTGALCSPRPN